MKQKLALELAAKEGIALTFKDVRLRTASSEVLPDEVDISSQFSRNVPLKIPIVSAAMDTVTESKMAIEMAKLGGLGVIHRNLTPEEQAENVSKVKHYLNGLILKPICIHEEESIEDILIRRKEKGYAFDSFPVISSENKLVGIVTETDFTFSKDNSQLVKDIMCTNLWTAPKGTNLNDAYKMMMKEKRKLLPLINKNGELTGMYVFRDVKRIVTRSAETYNVDSNNRLRVAAAIGTGKDEFERAARLVDENVDVLVIDTAHADTKSAINMLKELKKKYSDVDIVVGNVSIGESAKRLADAGADGIKVGQGPGSICTTRIIAGVGRPQVSAVYDCAKVLKKSKYNIPICADGGIEYSGDIPIAIAAGANCVMVGSLLAGTDEAPGEVIFFEGRQWKEYRGMGSLGAMESSRSSKERYFQGARPTGKLIPEGVEARVQYKGKVESVIAQYVGGLKSGMGYTGSKTIKHLRDNTEFDRITQAGLAESHPHNIAITKEPPNYRTP